MNKDILEINICKNDFNRDIHIFIPQWGQTVRFANQEGRSDLPFAESTARAYMLAYAQQFQVVIQWLDSDGTVLKSQRDNG